MRDNALMPITAVFSGLSALVAGFDSIIVALVVFMVIDFATGLIATIVFDKSKHGKSGLESKVCWRGLYKKGVSLLLCLVATYFDRLLGTYFVQNAVAIGFIVSESISILENAGLMGIPIPAPLRRAIAVLRDKEGVA